MYKIADDKNKKAAKSYDSFNDSSDQSQSPDDSKICSEYGSGDPVDVESIKRKVRNPEFVCSSCGRSASESSDLCAPEEL